MFSPTAANVMSAWPPPPSLRPRSQATTWPVGQATGRASTSRWPGVCSPRPPPPTAPGGGECGRRGSEGNIFLATNHTEKHDQFPVSVYLKIRRFQNSCLEIQNTRSSGSRAGGPQPEGLCAGSPGKLDLPRHSSLCPVRCRDDLMPRADSQREGKGAAAASGSPCCLLPPAAGNGTGLGQGFPSLT